MVIQHFLQPESTGTIWLITKYYIRSDKKDPARKNGRNLNLITCEECGLICAGQSHYNVHIRSHTGKCLTADFIPLYFVALFRRATIQMSHMWCCVHTKRQLTSSLQNPFWWETISMSHLFISLSSSWCIEWSYAHSFRYLSNQH